MLQFIDGKIAVRSFFIYVFFFYLVVCSSCTNRAEDEMVFEKLISWDLLIDREPQNVSDSLKTIQPENLSRNSRAYFYLLKVITDDKNYVNFSSDSLINSVTDYYRVHDPRDKNYIRALAYQGIVRTRMGIKDSTVYEPLREADKLLNSKPEQDPSLGYLINYFLGNIHHNSRNYVSANNHFQRTLEFAREEKDSVHVFDTFLAFFWNEMQQKNIEKSKSFLDSLSTFYNLLPGKDYFILNAQSIYYDIIGDPENALEREKTKLVLYNAQEENIELSRAYFSISNRYVSLEQLDSAMLYAQMAVDIIEDTSFVYNHLYYENIANIAESQKDFTYANYYRKKASESFKNSISGRLDTQIAELEKKYDLTEAENKALIAHQQNMQIIIVALLLVIILILALMYARRMKRETQLKLIQTENRVQQQEMQAAIMSEEAGKRKWLLLLYSNISSRLTFLQEEFEKLTQRYVSSQPKVYKEMQLILKSTDIDLRDINKTLAPDDKTFYSYTHLEDQNGILNSNDKMMLMLIACDADNRQLATFMNTTVDSIRVRKSQLKKKMLDNGLETSLFTE